jgi:hypothetical protein
VQIRVRAADDEGVATLALLMTWYLGAVVVAVVLGLSIKRADLLERGRDLFVPAHLDADQGQLPVLGEPQLR